MKKIELLILTLGGTPGAITYSIKNIKPSTVFFIPSKDSKDSVDSIVSDLKKEEIEFEYQSFIIENPQDSNECYLVCKNSVMDGIEKLGIPANSIRADITGGTKIMSFALGMAAASFAIQLSYIGGQERNKDGLGTVQPGFESLIISENPWKEFQEEERKRFITLFNSNEFKSASEIAKSLSENKRLSDEDRLFYKDLKLVSEGYYFWDLWIFDQAYYNISDGKKRYERYRRYFDSKYSDFFKRTIAISEEYLDKDILRNQIPTYEKIRDLIGNIFRRAEQGKFDDASLRLYRVLEMYAQNKLYEEFQINPSKISKTELDSIQAYLKNFEINVYIGDKKVQSKSSNEYIRFDLKDNLYHTGGQYQNYVLLDYLSKSNNKKESDNIGHKMIRGEYSRDRKDIELIRNESYLTHGNSPIKESTFIKNFLKLITMGILRSTSIPPKTSNFKDLSPDGLQMVKFPKLPL